MRTFEAQRKSTRLNMASAAFPVRRNAGESVAQSAANISAGIAHNFSAINVTATSTGRIQPKLSIGAPGDVYEQEADRIADRVVGMSEPQVQRAATDSGDAGEIANPSVVSRIVSTPGRPLDPSTRGFMESRFGHDFGRVRIHTDARSGAAAQALNARAFTFDRHIVFGAGEYNPNGSTGRKLLAHELTHVVQQRGGGGSARSNGATPITQGAPHTTLQRQKKPDPAVAKAQEAAFLEWWKLVTGFEGSLEDWKKQPANKNDRGGETNWGITKKLYMQHAEKLGLSATEAGFAAMTPDQAMLFGRMMWKSSGASKVKNTGVAIVLADWYWGGIHLDRLSAILKAHGRAATFNKGTPDQATIDFLNTLDPADMIEQMSDAKAAQYKAIVKKDPTQKEFLEGWLKRNEERRQQARPFIPPGSNLSIWEQAQRAMRQARGLEESANAEQKQAVKDELQRVIRLIDRKERSGFAHAEEEVSLKTLRRDLQQTLADVK